MARRKTAIKRDRLTLRLAFVSLVVILALSILAPTVLARTYTITDGDRVVTYTTFATDPARILDQAGLALGSADTYTAGGEHITVRRARTVTVIYHGLTTRTATFGETAGELLSRLNLPVSGEDVVSHGMDTPVYDGMELRVDSVIIRRESYSVAVPHGTTYCSDASIPAGMEEVLVAGSDGELLRTATVTYRNGQEVRREVLSETQTRAPVTEIIGRGTGAAPASTDPDALPVICDGYILLPTGEVLTYVDKLDIRASAYTHTDAGCDFITSTGTTVRWGTVAVDPRYIPYGTRMFVIADDGSFVYGVATAEDCGGAIKVDRMDLYMPTYWECIQFGRRDCTAYVLG